MERLLANTKDKKHSVRIARGLRFAFMKEKNINAKTVVELAFVFTKNVEIFATTRNAMAALLFVAFRAAIKFLAKNTGATA